MKINYPLSKSILEKIKSSRNILINVHKNPDLDAVGSASAMNQVLEQLGKSTALISPSKISESFLFLKGAPEINTVDFKTFDFSKFDLFIVLDTATFDRATGEMEIGLRKTPDIVIDHHKVRGLTGKITLIDVNAIATSEILYGLFKDWKVKFTKDISTSLFAGIAGDSVFFKYTKNAKETFQIATELLEKGADKDRLVELSYNSLDFNFVKVLGIFIEKMKYEKTGNFVWGAIPLKLYEKYGRPEGARETAADSFFRSIKDVKFGVAILETKKGELSLSFRSSKFDVSKIAAKFGGGGHAQASGATVKGEFKKSVSQILESLRSPE